LATKSGHFLPVVYGEVPLSDAIFRIPEGDFDFVGTQAIGADPSVIYNTANAQSIISSLAKQYDVVIIDAPSLITAADSSMMSGGLDMGIFAIPSGQFGLRSIERNLVFFNETEFRDTGIVLTDQK
jgi:Mrp family chromosome partitioning ATPase